MSFASFIPAFVAEEVRPAFIDNVIDAVTSPQTTGQPIPQEVMHAAVVLGYSGHSNSFETFEPYQAARPDLTREHRVIPVTLSCDRYGHVYDIEPGGGSNANIGIFMHNAIHVWGTPALFGLPWLYTFASNVRAMIAAARGFGYEQGRDYYVLSAHPNTRFGRHVCGRTAVCGYPTADGTQYLFAGRYDESYLSSYMVPALAPMLPPDPYDLFPTFVGDTRFPNRGNERLTVKRCDGALKRPRKYHAYLKGELRSQVKAYRDRCWRIAKFEPPFFTRRRQHPVWADHRHLGARWQALNHRIKHIDALY